MNKFSKEKRVLDTIDYLDYFVSRAMNPDNTSSDMKFFRNRESNSHFITLFALAMSIRAKYVLDLGVKRGQTTLPILYAVSILGGRMDSVDIKKTKFEPPKSMRKHWKFHKKDALSFLNNIPEDKIYDLVFVDDFHGYEHVKQELEIITKHVTKRGLIILHDCMLYTAPDYTLAIQPGDDELDKGGPYKAVSELDSNEWEFATIPVMHGLTILRKLK